MRRAEIELPAPTDSSLKKLRNISGEEYAKPGLLPDFDGENCITALTLYSNPISICER